MSVQPDAFCNFTFAIRDARLESVNYGLTGTKLQWYRAYTPILSVRGIPQNISEREFR